MKKITFLMALFVSGLAIQAQNTFVGNGSGDPVYNTPVDQRSMVVITHSNTQTINPGDEIACANTVIVNNSIFRDFDLAGDFGIVNDFIVTDAEIAIGIGVLTAPGGFPITINIYSMTTAFPATWPGSATLEGTAGVVINDSDAETLVSVPIAATIPAGSRMIYEVVAVSDAVSYLRFGANLDGQTAPSWIMAADCGAPTPADLFAAFGLPNSFVMNIVGDEGLGLNDNLLAQVAVYPNPMNEVLNITTPSNVDVTNVVMYDILGKNTGVRLVNGTMNTSNLARGVYMLNIETTAGTLTQKVVKN